MNIGFIDYYLDEWHANNYPRLLSEATGGKMNVTLAYGHIDSPIGGRTTDKWCADMNIPRAASIEEVCEKSDVFALRLQELDFAYEVFSFYIVAIVWYAQPLCQRFGSTGTFIYHQDGGDALFFK